MEFSYKELNKIEKNHIVNCNWLVLAIFIIRNGGSKPYFWWMEAAEFVCVVVNILIMVAAQQFRFLVATTFELLWRTTFLGIW